MKAPATSRYSNVPAKKPPPPTRVQPEADEDEGDDDDLSEISEEFDDEASVDSGNESEDNGDDAQSSEDVEEDEDEDEDQEMDDVDETPVAQPKAVETSARERKRKRKDEHDDLEAKYLTKLAKEDEPEGKRRRASPSAEKNGDASDDNDAIPVHESLSKDDKTSEIEKAARTVFLANVSSSAISSKSAKKTLLTHLTSIFPEDDLEAPKVESLRFRSVAFAEMSMPKRAAYITGSLLNATTQSTNAYAVYSTAAAARKAATELNGTVVLDRHIRVDSVAHPTPTAHRRCVFVGNLGYVDDETIVKKDENGETTEKKRNKVPADVEEGLWRTFGAQGKVENVRVVRDPKTRVGKGFAYVQFYVSDDQPISLSTLRSLTQNTGFQRCRALPTSRRQEIPAHASPSSSCHSRKGPPQDSSRPRALSCQNHRPRHEEHQVQVQAHARGAVHGRPHRQAPRPFGCVPAEKGPGQART